jgi:surface polysaccharide O-acyltransferase-like enzyme
MIGYNSCRQKRRSKFLNRIMSLNRVKAIDVLRTISIAAVLLIHTTTKVLEATHYDLATYSFTLFLNQLARFAVPLFILISGFVLELNYDYHTSYWAYLKKRVSKIFIPYLFWSLIYYYFIYTGNHDNLSWVLLTGNASYQLYFIPTLCIFYMAFPLLHKLYKYLAMPLVLLFLGGLQIWLMSQDYFVKQFSFPDPVRIFILSYLFFILGMIAGRNKDKIIEIVGKIKYALIILIPYLVYYIFEEGKTRYFKTYNIEAFYSQWRPSVLIYTLVLGAILFYIFNKSRFESKIIEKFSKLSYPVFFIHVIVLEVVWRYFPYNNIGKIAYDPIFFILVATFSFGAAYLIHKVPHLSKLTG